MKYPSVSPWYPHTGTIAMLVFQFFKASWYLLIINFPMIWWLFDAKKPWKKPMPYGSKYLLRKWDWGIIWRVSRTFSDSGHGSIGMEFLLVPICSNGPADRGRYAVEIWLLVIAFKRLGVAFGGRSGDISAVFWAWKMVIFLPGKSEGFNIANWNMAHDRSDDLWWFAANCDKNHSYIKYAEGIFIGNQRSKAVEISSNRSGYIKHGPPGDIDARWSQSHLLLQCGAPVYEIAKLVHS